LDQEHHHSLEKVKFSAFAKHLPVVWVVKKQKILFFRESDALGPIFFLPMVNFCYRIGISYQIEVLEPLKHVFHALKKCHEVQLSQH